MLALDRRSGDRLARCVDNLDIERHAQRNLDATLLHARPALALNPQDERSALGAKRIDLVQAWPRQEQVQATALVRLPGLQRAVLEHADRHFASRLAISIDDLQCDALQVGVDRCH